MTGFIYLASPYSHQDAQVREQRYLAVCRATAALMRAGHVVFSPIAHSHPIEVSGMGETLSGEFWKRQDIPLLRHASRLAVLMLPGWEVSAGIEWEIETALALCIPVYYLNPESPTVGMGFDLIDHLYRQRSFSLRTFGPGLRTGTVSDHIRKELAEVAEHPTDLMEWVDVILLALDGAHRTGASPSDIARAITAKQAKNEMRKWPNWREVPDGQAIEHVRGGALIMYLPSMTDQELATHAYLHGQTDLERELGRRFAEQLDGQADRATEVAAIGAKTDMLTRRVADLERTNEASTRKVAKLRGAIELIKEATEKAMKVEA